MAYLRIAGVEVAQPADVQVGRFDISKANRSADGVMVMEIVRAGVRRVDVTWQYISDSDLEMILDLIASHKPFVEIEYEDAGGFKTMVAYTGDIMYKPWHRRNGVRIWREVTIPFIER